MAGMGMNARRPGDSPQRSLRAFDDSPGTCSLDLDHFPLLLLMYATWRIDALIGKRESFHRLSSENVRLNDLRDIGYRDAAIPHGVRVDDDCRSVLALIEATGLVRPDLVIQAARDKFFLKGELQLTQCVGITATSGMTVGTFVCADKNMMFEKWHELFYSVGAIDTNRGCGPDHLRTSDTKRILE